jgi:hypothetical protein
MKYRAVTVIGLLSLVALAPAPPATTSREANHVITYSRNRVSFEAVDIYIDPQGHSLAAYQFELKVAAGDVTTVGVEGGEHAAFREAPYYDPAAMARRRIIVAAFNTGSDLPAGRTRVARVHVRVGGGERPRYLATLEAAADADGKPIAGATVTVAEGAGT